MSTRIDEAPGGGRQRCRGARGMAMATGLVLMFVLTAGGVIWLARDVNRSVSNRSAASSIAFQAARSGAQEVNVDSVRGVSGGGDVQIDPVAAPRAAQQTVRLLLDDYGLSGRIDTININGDRIEVTVTITDSAGDRTGVGVARAEPGQ